MYHIHTHTCTQIRKLLHKSLGKDSFSYGYQRMNAIIVSKWKMDKCGWGFGINE